MAFDELTPKEVAIREIMMDELAEHMIQDFDESSVMGIVKASLRTEWEQNPQLFREEWSRYESLGAKIKR